MLRVGPQCCGGSYFARIAMAMGGGPSEASEEYSFDWGHDFLGSMFSTVPPQPWGFAVMLSSFGSCWLSFSVLLFLFGGPCVGVMPPSLISASTFLALLLLLVGAVPSVLVPRTTREGGFLPCWEIYPCCFTSHFRETLSCWTSPSWKAMRCRLPVPCWWGFYASHHLKIMFCGELTGPWLPRPWYWSRTRPYWYESSWLRGLATW